MLADHSGENRGDREDDSQGEADQRLHEGERSAAKRVLDFEAEQRVPGDPRGAGEESQPHGEERHNRQVRDDRDRTQQHARSHQRAPEQPATRHRQQKPRATPHAERQAAEHRAEQQPVAGVSSAEVGDVDARKGDHDAAGREGTDDTDDKTPDERGPGARTPIPRR